MSLAHLLLVDDEQQILRALRPALSAAGYEVATAETGGEALAYLASEPCDVVILDLGLPDMDGKEVIARIREWSEAPILVLSARDLEHEKIAALDQGADDFINKPFGVGELLARIRAVLRRRVDTDLDDNQVLESGTVRMDVERHTVSVDGKDVPMPLKEFELLELLLRNSGRVLTRGQLIDRVWGADYFGDTKTLDVHIKRIRSKIEKVPGEPTMLVTVRGLGYRFEA